MTLIQDFHTQAMNLAEQAELAKRRGAIADSHALLREALQLEQQAAQLVANNPQAEPTRSILHRSAAALAIDCGELLTAEKLIVTALTGTPPADLAAELKDLFIQLNLRSYLERRGVQLAEEQLSRLAS